MITIDHFYVFFVKYIYLIVRVVRFVQTQITAIWFADFCALPHFIVLIMRSYRDWHPYRHFDFPGMDKAKLELYTRICHMDEITFNVEQFNLVAEVQKVLIDLSPRKKRKYDL